MLEGVDSIESALYCWGGRTDPESAGARLLLLIRGERFEEAAKLARELLLHRRWLDKAILALAADGDITQANTLLTSDADLRREDFLTFCKCVNPP